MNTNKNVKNIAGTDYYVLNEENIFDFGMTVTTWAGEKVNRVDVHPIFPGNPRKLTVVTETGKKFQVVVGNCQIPLAHFA